jgi:hypothetical protein
MGFRIEPTEYKLNFTDPRLNGLTVQAKSVSIGRFMEITGVTAAAAIGGITLKDEAVARDPMLDALAEVITTWNLEDEKGKAVDPGYDALRDQEPWVIRDIYKAWMEAVSGVSAPLPNSSGSQASSPELSIPMDTE